MKVFLDPLVWECMGGKSRLWWKEGCCSHYVILLHSQSPTTPQYQSESIVELCYNVIIERAKEEEETQVTIGCPQSWNIVF